MRTGHTLGEWEFGEMVKSLSPGDKKAVGYVPFINHLFCTRLLMRAQCEAHDYDRGYPLAVSQPQEVGGGGEQEENEARHRESLQLGTPLRNHAQPMDVRAILASNVVTATSTQQGRDPSCSGCHDHFCAVCLPGSCSGVHPFSCD